MPVHYIIPRFGQFLHTCLILQAVDMQCKYSAHILQSEIASLRKDMGFHEVSEGDGVKLFVRTRQASSSNLS